MKKSFIVLSSLFLVVLFAGCSLTPGSSSDGKTASFTLSQSIWKSVDGGTSWKVKNIGEGKANTKNVEVLSLVINPLDKNNIFVGLRGGGILETNNGGETWRFINYQSGKVYGLALDPRDGRTLYASGVWEKRGKIFKTQSDGTEWKEIYTGPINGPLVISLEIDKKNPNILYATTSENEVIKSTDSGVSWKNIYLANAPILKVAIDATNSNLIYFVSNDGNVFRSKDGGENFENINSKISKVGSGGFKVLETSPVVGNQVFVAGTKGMVFSKDSGETWEEISTLNNSEKFPIKAIAINPKNSREMVYAMDQATYKSMDEGKTWVTSQFNNGMRINVLKYDPSGSGELYVGFTK